MRLCLIELRLLVWLGNYGHLSYEKQQELVWELGEINIGTSPFADFEEDKGIKSDGD